MLNNCSGFFLTSHRFGCQCGGQSVSILGMITMMLTDTAIRAAKPREMSWKLADYQGIYLLILPNGTKHWYLKYRFERKESRLGFGPYPLVTLAEARNKRDSTRKMISEGTHPVVARKKPGTTMPGITHSKRSLAHCINLISGEIRTMRRLYSVVWRIMFFLYWDNAALLLSKLAICFCY